MDYFLALIIGFLAAFFGLLAPAMLNMTAAKTSIERGKSSGIKFAAGASSIVIVHASIAVYFAKFLVANPQIITRLKVAAIFVLITLSFFFFWQAKREAKITVKERKGFPFLIGLGMSSLNMMGIPFYLAIATLAESKGWLQLIYPYSILYVLGAVLGSFAIFSLYVLFAIVISKRASFIAKNINYILSGLFIILALTTIIQVLN